MATPRKGTGRAPTALRSHTVEPDEQRTLIIEQWEGARFPVARLGNDLYMPLSSLARYFGVDARSQRETLQQDRALSRYLRFLYIRGKGGRQSTLCILLRAMPLYLVKLDIDYVREELQDGLLAWVDTVIEATAVLFFGSATDAALLTATDAGDVEDLRAQVARQQLEIGHLKFALRLQGRRLSTIERHALPANVYFDIEPDEE